MLHKVLFDDRKTELPGLVNHLRVRARQRMVNTG